MKRPAVPVFRPVVRASFLEALAVLLPAGAAALVLVITLERLPDQNGQQRARARDDLRVINAALLSPERRGGMPDTRAGLAVLVRDGILPSLPDDPWGRPYQYRQPGQVRAVELFSLGPDGVESQDDIVAWNLYGGR